VILKAEYDQGKHKQLKSLAKKYFKVPTRFRKACESKYHLQNVALGRGSYGSVYEACLPDRDCSYAVKVIKLVKKGRTYQLARPPSKTPSEWNEERASLKLAQREFLISYLAGEAGIGPKIMDAWICDKYQGSIPELSNHENPLLFIVMKKVVGLTLKKYLESKKPTPTLCQELAAKIHLLRIMGIQHCDLHRDNVYILPDETVQIIDWGHARAPTIDGTGGQYLTSCTQKDKSRLHGYTKCSQLE